MSTVDAVGSATSATAQAQARNQLDSKDFINLMLTQFRNQDPFKPMDSTQFLGQLAQFSTVSGIDSMRSTLEGLSTSLRSDQVLSGANLVGRDVLAPGNKVALGKEGEVHGAVDAPSGAQQVVVSVKDAAGQLVRRFTVAASDGLTEFTWDGMTSTGARAPVATYTLEAASVTGTTQQSQTVLLSDRVNSVTIDSQNQSLILNTSNLGPLQLTDVQRIG